MNKETIIHKSGVVFYRNEGSYITHKERFISHRQNSAAIIHLVQLPAPRFILHGPCDPTTRSILPKAPAVTGLFFRSKSGQRIKWNNIIELWPLLSGSVARSPGPPPIPRACWKPSLGVARSPVALQGFQPWFANIYSYNFLFIYLFILHFFGAWIKLQLLGSPNLFWR